MDIAGLSFEDEAGYKRFADLAAHEFFHAWNVKRIHDAALGPFDYTRENYTRLLWLYEGFTDYLAHVIILRAGVTRERDFLQDDRRGLAPVRDAPGAQRDAARRAVVRGLGQAVQAVGELHQPRGQLLREGALDRRWRSISSCGWRPAAGAACPRCSAGCGSGSARASGRSSTADVRDAAAAIAGRAMDRFFDRYMRGTDELPLPALLATRRAGRSRRAPTGTRAAGRPPTAIRCAAGRARAWTGIALQPERTLVRNVVPGSPAWRAGLTFNDEHRRRRRRARDAADVRQARRRPPARRAGARSPTSAASCSRRRR